MRTIKITVLLAVLLSMVGAKSFAYDIAVANADGVTIYYNYIKYKTELEVTYLYHASSSNGSAYYGSVVIPESVTYDGKTYSVTSIGIWAFNRCSSLTSVTIGNSVTSIDHDAFRDCSSLTSVDIPNSVTSIGSSAFSYCSSLTSVTIPNSVTSIGSYAFSGCRSLTSVTIGNGVTSISSSAFSGCSSLTSVTIGNGVTSIGSYAFSDCSGLTSVTIPNSVTYIGPEAFQLCSNLASIVLGNAVEGIGSNAFANCKKLEDVYCYAIRYPSSVSYDAFNNSYIDYVTLHVPAQSVTQYRNQSPWSGFMDVVPLTGTDPQPTGIESVYATGVSNESQNSKYFTLGGKQFSQPQRGLNIVKMSDGTTKKVVVTK